MSTEMSDPIAIIARAIHDDDADFDAEQDATVELPAVNMDKTKLCAICEMPRSPHELSGRFVTWSYTMKTPGRRVITGKSPVCLRCDSKETAHAQEN